MYVCVFMYVLVYLCMCVCMYVYERTHLCIDRSVYLRTHTHTRSSLALSQQPMDIVTIEKKIEEKKYDSQQQVSDKKEPISCIRVC